MAWICILAQDGCDYARLTGASVQSLTSSKTIPYAEVGRFAYRTPVYFPDENAWRVQYSETCLSYDDDVVERDGYWKVSQAFSFLALVFGGGGTLFLWCSTCLVFGRGTWRWAGFEILSAAIMQALGLLWFLTGLCKEGGNSRCGLFFGSKCDIGAVVLWWASAVTILVKFPKPYPKPVLVVKDEREMEGMIHTPGAAGERGVPMGDGYPAPAPQRMPRGTFM
eukprot:CAMPEP_0185727926 /NCGR_PEP_ID=MMETSP1171-20130828/3459_1 /TAXON_ID=374046 /ORGANISM="Helicotheca tamensis, Strain CCMP826" /LENGTH=222 /DNA_ID=CAMNT_0028396571 /DNA_START=65 /DNA_END=733 /DNA_ORIENTATION=+